MTTLKKYSAKEIFLAVLVTLGLLVGLPIFGGQPALVQEYVVPVIVVMICGLTTVTLKVTFRIEGKVDQSRKEAGYQWALSGLLASDPRLLPPLGGGAVSAERGHEIVTQAREIGARTVVELGPGASTALLGLWNQSVNGDLSVYGVEHDERWAARVDLAMKTIGFDRFRLITAPLRPCTIGEWKGEWFDLEVLKASLPDEVDLLIVDGPPNYTGGDNRFPALAAFRPYLKRGSRIYVDDTNRSSEGRMVDAWIRESDLRVIRRAEEFCVLEVV